MVECQRVKLETRVQSSVQDSIFLFQFSNLPTGGLVLKITVYEEQLETTFSRETENVFILSLYYDVDGIGATPPPVL